MMLSRVQRIILWSVALYVLWCGGIMTVYHLSGMPLPVLRTHLLVGGLTDETKDERYLKDYLLKLLGDVANNQRRVAYAK